MKNIIILISVLLAFPLSMRCAEPADTLTIFMIGDSTMADKPTDSDKEERGWGQMLSLWLQGPVRVDNHARNGESSLSFINRGKWDRVVESIRPGDYVIIQFGHNDEKLNKQGRGTHPGGDFDANLRKFVTETQAKGGKPILMNSIVRRHFPAVIDSASAAGPPAGKPDPSRMDEIVEGELLVDTHGPWRDAPRNVAQSMSVPFVDMNSITHANIQKLGPIESRPLFMWIAPGKYEFCPEGRIDNTHLTIYGATVVAGWAAEALTEQVPELSRYIRPCPKKIKY